MRDSIFFRILAPPESRSFLARRDGKIRSAVMTSCLARLAWGPKAAVVSPRGTKKHSRAFVLSSKTP
ncbi:hypothetical protein SPRG_01412 [Saprolegnia parasitica CBS 223.65]|uniref:Uncharacterized protein n=1 Tax=Saprolegnia parasitica (strain CBS 223.65) TaxID=695850 RepID=A0A067D572_SAPPC|nr:hypothetical protein SPRG_01412 [Saprolegnia parasitica CBS 223.65]KDO34142.1 hypothetical protein SPRG_01412 [Saprolegnia parasitica CBS 223.65]|eukprot:XP_012195019.1 hypothetical protein SPRG_01412 [Saprolegnia parasitica CBS 223.65]